MPSTPVSFTSAGLRLDGDLALPDGRPAGRSAPLRAIVTACGYTGIRAAHPARFARALAPRGWAVLGFDYRGSGTSEGERGRIFPEEQADDLCAAVQYLRAVDWIDPDRIAVLGWGLGGGVAVTAAAREPAIAAVVACNPIGDGERALRFMHAGDLGSLLDLIERDRGRRSAGRPSRCVPAFSVVTPRNATLAYLEEERRAASTFVTTVSLESAEALLGFRPEEVVGRIAPRPLLLVHGAENDLHSPVESRALYARAGEPKEHVLLADRGHTEWMRDGNPTFGHVVSLIDDFLSRRLA